MQRSRGANIARIFLIVVTNGFVLVTLIDAQAEN